MSLLDNLELYTKLDGNSNDSSGNGRNGTDHSMTYSTADGKINQGGNFNGSTKWIGFSYTKSFNDLTMAIWVKITGNAPSNGGWIMDAHNAPVTSSFNLNIRPTTNFLTFGGLATAATNSTNMNDSAWHLVVGVRSGTTLILYLDGVESARATGDTAGSYSVAGTSIGSNNGVANWFVTASLDEGGLWSRALTTGEIEILYNKGFGRSFPFVYLDANLHIRPAPFKPGKFPQIRSKRFNNNLLANTPASTPIFKSLQYSVDATPSALTKSLKYTVDITPSGLTKSLQYAIFDPHIHKVYIRPNIMKPRPFAPGLAR